MKYHPTNQFVEVRLSKTKAIFWTIVAVTYVGIIITSIMGFVPGF